MPRKLLGLSLLLLIPALQAAPALVPRPPALAAASWILVEASTGTVLVEHEADTALPPASLTKMMTDYVVAAELAAGRATLDDLVPISEKAWRMDGSKMFVRVGDQVRLEDLSGAWSSSRVTMPPWPWRNTSLAVRPPFPT